MLFDLRSQFGPQHADNLSKDSEKSYSSHARQDQVDRSNPVSGTHNHNRRTQPVPADDWERNSATSSLLTFSPTCACPRFSACAGAMLLLTDVSISGSSYSKAGQGRFWLFPRVAQGRQAAQGNPHAESHTSLAAPAGKAARAAANNGRTLGQQFSLRVHEWFLTAAQPPHRLQVSEARAAKLRYGGLHLPFPTPYICHHLFSVRRRSQNRTGESGASFGCFYTGCLRSCDRPHEARKCRAHGTLHPLHHCPIRVKIRVKSR